MINQKTAFIKHVTLNVKNIDLMRDFYEKVFIWDTLNETDTTRSFGVNQQTLLTLIDVSSQPLNTSALGLYHVAYLLPNEKSFSSFVYHMIDLKIPLEGLSDHGVSGALYFTDPEGNGIEVYYDKPQSEWPYINGQLEMYTKAYALETLKQAYEYPYTKAPKDMTIGHIHLHVDDLQTHIKFYESLGMTLMQNFHGSAAFLSYDGYHHHIGINTWKPRTKKLEKETLGLHYFTIKYDDKKLFNELIERYQTRLIQDPTYHNIQLEVDEDA